MASPDAFKSSPKRDRLIHFTASSSPTLPALEDLLPQRYRRSPLKNGSRAVPLLADGDGGFHSAHSLYKASLTEQSSEKIDKRKEVPLESHDKEDSPYFIADDATEQAPKPSRQRKADRKTVARHGSAGEPQEHSTKTVKKARKSREKVTAGSSKTSKAIDNLARKSPSPAKPTPPISPHPINAETVVLESVEKPEAEASAKGTTASATHWTDLQLERAPARRMDWTPPPADNQTIVIDSSPSATRPRCSPSSRDGGSAQFKGLVESFKRVDSEEDTTSTPHPVAIFKQPKAIELVGTNHSHKKASPEVQPVPAKQKAPRKKARTITDLATEAYRVQEEPLLPTTSVLDLVAGQSKSQEAPDANPTGKGKGKRARTTAKASRKKKKPSPVAPKLLSPTAAMKQALQQDILFGTSSQLAREHSPTLLRDLQSAIKLSTELKSDPFTTPINSDAIEPPETSMKLWEAAARDEDGGLFDMDVVDLVEEHPSLAEPEGDLDPFGYTKGIADGSTKGAPASARQTNDTSFADLSEILAKPAADGEPGAQSDAASTWSHSQLSTSSNVPKASRAQRSSSAQVTLPQCDAAAAAQVPQSQAAVTSNWDEPDATVAREEAPSAPQPNFELYSDARLSNELRRFGFKPVKRRTVMLSLLEQCWKSQNIPAPLRPAGQAAQISTSAVLQRSKDVPDKTRAPKRPRGRPRKDSTPSELCTEPPPSAQPTQSPKRPRGRPRKTPLLSETSTATTATSKITKKPKASRKPSLKAQSPAKVLIEIPDSESDVSSSSTVSRSASPEQPFSSPEPVDLSLSVAEDTELSQMLPNNDEDTDLFKCITGAVKSASRGNDPAHPSWHEKMLLYDPIIIEDLTAWLNSGQLTRVGYDGEVKPADVKRWCESQSVCCLWKVNLRGKERKRY